MVELFVSKPAELSCKSDVKLYSAYLERTVVFDIYAPAHWVGDADLLLVNDGQDLRKMNFTGLLRICTLPVIGVAIHCSADRVMEYGTIGEVDYAGRGAKASLYSQFIITELIPFIESLYETKFAKKAFAGFSLGGLSAFDIAWNHPHEFSYAAVFSGSLWWRRRNYDDPAYNWVADRIVHNQVKHSSQRPNLKFFFECGFLDETADRNNNGIIDSVEDTRDLVDELKQLGYSDEEILSIELPDGRHDVATWERAFPKFLEWAFGAEQA